MGVGIHKIYAIINFKIENNKIDNWMQLLQCFMIMKNILVIVDIVSTSINEVNHSNHNTPTISISQTSKNH